MTRRDSGAVSIFVVIFAALLLTVVTVSFIRIMINDQQQATANDLSQSAYDSAQAGVEDAKRALLKYLAACTDPSSAACSDIKLDLANNECNTALIATGVISGSSVGASGSVGSGEIRVQQDSSSTDDALDQAYTCVKINLDTPDYLGDLTSNESAFFPIRGSSDFDTVTIEWFSRDDLPDPATATSVDLLSGVAASSKPLRAVADWPADRPPVMRAQMIQVGSSFNLQAFDTVSGTQSNTNTVFLYPVGGAVGVNSADFFGRDPRRDVASTTTPQDINNNSPLGTVCQPSLSSGGYSCKMSLTLPDPIGGGDAASSFLRLTSFYNLSHFRVTLSSGLTPVPFSGVQPEIDSTGRANEQFRRVVSRIDLSGSFPYPEAALDVTGNLCKDFAITDTRYIAGSCTP